MQTANTSLDSLLDRGNLWQGARTRTASKGIPSGHPELDRRLAGQGWQPGNLIELLYTGEGSGELRLLYPLLAALSQQPQWIIWVDPPHVPYAPALAAAGIDIRRILMVHSRARQEQYWALEQALKSGECSAVLGWAGAQADDRALRRLQLAASQGQGLGFLFRPKRCRQLASAAPYRALLEADPQGVALTLFKRRQGWSLPRLQLPLQDPFGPQDVNSAPLAMP
ncbi:translesion DNA synthesis-associated protein ImuA [Motiliproteus sp. SC1-56]|uniref:translesion DNA synthesis-associated protein ImuA n=1 Tax=Motiliproteus sp. SC1-56 TaxID=2799565 RepID=UPI001A8FBFE1|nr:translesion DNA synthesis-associated protein ImuA [Motiliproteus sp. SC1-56]